MRLSIPVLLTVRSLVICSFTYVLNSFLIFAAFALSAALVLFSKSVKDCSLTPVLIVTSSTLGIAGSILSARNDTDVLQGEVSGSPKIALLKLTEKPVLSLIKV